MILEVDEARVRTPSEFAQAVARKKGPVKLTTEGARTVTIK